MDAFLSHITQQAMNYAIRSGIALTSGYAIKQCTRLLQTVDGHDRDEIASLQQRLQSKIHIVSPAIDMIELIAARGNTSLDSAVTLTKSIRAGIQALGVRLDRYATDEEQIRLVSSRTKTDAQRGMQVKLIIADIKKLLIQIEDAVPLINLAITTSGVNLSTTLPSTVSPSRLLQASMFLTSGDSQYVANPGVPIQVGPVFVLSLYMLFSGHAHRINSEDGIREATWKEVIHKARVKLIRVPNDHYDPLRSSDSGRHGENSFGSIPSESQAHEFAYQLLVVEDLDDDRVHTFDDDEAQPEPFDDVVMAGIRANIPIHQISKIFYADTSKILNIRSEGEDNSPALLLKRDINAVPPRRMMDDTNLHGEEDEDDEYDGTAQLRRESVASPVTATTHTDSKPEPWRLPLDLDPEWMAFEVYTEAEDEDDEFDESPPEPQRSVSTPFREVSVDPIASKLSHLKLESSSAASSPLADNSKQLTHVPDLRSPAPTFASSSVTLPALRTSLSLLELLIRLTALQQFRQSSHLAIDDEMLNFFLSESSSTGAGADSDRRKQMRSAARRRVGFDPYAESPVKLRGEQYLADHERQRHFEDEYDHDYENMMPNSSPQSAGLAARRSFGPGSTFSQQSSPLPARAPRASRSSTPNTPQGLRPKTQVLRAESDGKKQSPLARTESDSTLGTSPQIEGI